MFWNAEDKGNTGVEDFEDKGNAEDKCSACILRVIKKKAYSRQGILAFHNFSGEAKNCCCCFSNKRLFHLINQLYQVYPKLH